jgi:hypothetical protein
MRTAQSFSFTTRANSSSNDWTRSVSSAVLLCCPLRPAVPSAGAERGVWCAVLSSVGVCCVRCAESPSYIPSYDDIIHVRARTSGIKETQFEVKGNKFRLLDVGGQKNERKKWIHSFEGVTAVIFVAAISEYDQTMYEDLKTNRMQDALSLFDDICNSKWFPRTSMILFLNKSGNTHKHTHKHTYTHAHSHTFVRTSALLTH